MLAPQHNKANHSITNHTHNKDEKIGHNEDGRHKVIMKVEVHIGDISSRKRIGSA